MLFLVTAQIGDDDETRARHRGLRPQQFELVRRWAETGVMRFGGAILDQAGAQSGSVAIVEFETRADLDRWMSKHPYVVNGVWKDIDAREVQAAPIFSRRTA